MQGRLASIAFALLAAAASLAHAQERRVDELLVKSGLYKQVAQIEAMINMGLDEAQSRALAQGLKTAMPEATVSKVKAAVSASFGADVIRDACRNAFSERLTAADEGDVLAWLSTELGMRITRLEEKEDYTSTAEIAQRDAAVKRFFPTVPARRVALARRLAHATRSGEAAASIVINTTVGTTFGVAAAMPPLDTTLIERLRKRMEAQRPAMVAYLEELAVSEYAWSYRSLTDEELERYVAFAESPAAARYHQASIDAIENVFARGSMQLGLEIGAAVTPVEKRNS